jgi:hypothetical protein
MYPIYLFQNGCVFDTKVYKQNCTRYTIPLLDIKYNNTLITEVELSDSLVISLLIYILFDIKEWLQVDKVVVSLVAEAVVEDLEEIDLKG